MKSGSMIKLKLQEKAARFFDLFNPHRVNVEQLAPVLESGNSSLISSAVLALIISSVMQNPESLDIMRAWTAICLVAIGCGFISLSVVRSHFNSEKQILPAYYILTVFGAIRGGIWGACFYLMLPFANTYEQIMLGWTIAGVMCAGAFSAWSLPSAALSFAGSAGLGGFLGMLAAPGVGNTWMPFVAPLLFMFLMRMVLVSATVFRKSIESEKEVAAKNEVIGLLLRDFEESASDWLWETDSDGRVTRGIERFARILELPVEKLSSKFTV
jgi:PAS domain-containing protein